MEVVERLNELLKSCDECQVLSYHGDSLVIIGDFDLSYHHYFEAEFFAVSYIQCPTYFFAQAFRLATSEECLELNLADYADADDCCFCLESHERRFFIVAKKLSLKEGTVLHYKPEDPKPQP